MSPDLNSLPPSRPPSSQASQLASRPRRISLSTTDASRPSPPSPRSPSLSSLQAAATINAGLHRSPSGSSPARSGMERRRSSLLNNLSFNDSTVPGPGEMQASSGGASNGSSSNSPRSGRRSMALPSDSIRHGRQMSLGALHQELENEQEAQVNRLLHMISTQQDQLAAMSRQSQSQPFEPSPSSTEQSAYPTPPPNPATSLGLTTHIHDPHSPRNDPFASTHSSASFSRPQTVSRQSSRYSATGTSSHGGSPAARPISGSLGPLIEDFLLGGARDECAFYQAETQMLTRENQMLKHRIRELERQISDITSPPSHIHTPQSPLATVPATFTSESAPTVPAYETAPKD